MEDSTWLMKEECDDATADDGIDFEEEDQGARE
jgi:hypothetical protein